MVSLKGFGSIKVKFLDCYFWVFLSKVMQTLFWVFKKIFIRFYSSKQMDPISDSSEFVILNDQSELKIEANGEDCSECTKLENEDFENVSDIVLVESNQIESNCRKLEDEKIIGFCSENFEKKEIFDLEEEEKSKLVFKFQYQNWNCNFGDELKGNFSESSDFDKRGDELKGNFSESIDFDKRGEELKGNFGESSDFDKRGDELKGSFGESSDFDKRGDELKGSFGESSDFDKRGDEFKANFGESNDFDKRGDDGFGNANKYEFISEKSFSQFFDEPEAANFTVKEFFIHSNDSGLLSEEKFKQEDSEEVVNGNIGDDFVENLHVEEVSEKLKNLEPYAPRNFLLDDDFICSSSDSDSMSSLGDGFLSDTDFGTTKDEENEKDLDFSDEKSIESLDFGYEPDDFGEEEDEDIMDELRKLEEECKQEQSVKENSKGLNAIDLEESNRFDNLWEHQDLLEQLKMEWKKVRATGLPTIFEDSESPRIMEDLKPWKIDDKFLNRSTKNELPKFYRSYRERMRKFDILNYQKMYALGFMKSKDPLNSFSIHKKSSSTIKSIIPRGISFFRHKNNDDDPMKKFIRELYSDLEMVYMGHLCLSWEFLHWEYEKALKIWESDQYGLRRFNEVAGEFQQFQVLLQRFIENEPFQAPRVENYARNRCAMRNLLQVPVIREDKDKKKLRKREIDNDAITSDMLVEILEESIRTIWRFIRADKDASNVTIKGLKEHHVELQDPSDSQLLVEIQMDLQKKEKRLREVLRSGSCILKKFKKQDEDETDPVFYFFSQVDMKLVWRVLNMSRLTTDQLAWCRSKLNNINFVNRKLHVEPSFLLFPS